MILLRKGAVVEKVDSEYRLGEELSEHLRLPFEYVRINSGEIQIKSPYGFKAVIKLDSPCDDIEVILC